MWAGLDCFGCCRSCWSRRLASGPACRVGGEFDSVGVAQPLEDVLEVGGDGAPRDEHPLGDLSVGERLGHEADDPQLRGGEAVPSERGTAGAATAWDAEGAQRRVDPGDVPNGPKTVVDGDRLVQEGDRFVRSAGAPEGNSGVLAGRRERVGPRSVAVGGDGFQEDLRVVVNQTAAAQRQTPGGGGWATSSAALEFLGGRASSLLVAGGQSHPDQVRRHGS